MTPSHPSGSAGQSPARSGGDSLLHLAARLSVAATLTDQVDTTLPLLAERFRTNVSVFAVAGSRVAGVRCFPSDLAWAAVLREVFAASWEAGPLTLWCRRVGVVAPTRVQDVAPGWGIEPGLRLEHGGRVLEELMIIPMSRTGATIAAYFAARHDGTFDDAELEQAREVQAVLVASHGRFLRPPDPSLTARQQAVLRLLAEGRTVRAIASRLGISQSTVDKHVRDLYRRLGTQDRASTIRAAQVQGLLDGLGGEDWQDLLIVPER